MEKQRRKREKPFYLTRLTFPLIPAFTALFVLTACSGRSFITGEVAKYVEVPGDLLVSATIGAPKTFAPYIVSDAASYEVIDRIFDGLLEYSPDLRLVGNLAESYRVEHGGLKVVFKLRKDVKWHDGYPFTARDVVFTYNLIMDNLTPTPYRSAYEKVKSVEAIDNYTVVVRYKEPFVPALESWASAILPEHLKDKMKGQKAEGKNATLWLVGSPFASHPIGTGMFRFVKYVTNRYVLLATNPDYHKGYPKGIALLMIRVIPDQATIYLELKAGKVDWAGLTPNQYIKHDPYIEKNYVKFRYPSWGYTYIGYNFLRKPLNDVRVRKALSYAINTDEIVKNILKGLGRKLSGPFLPGSWAYNDKVKPIEYNPKKARELLKEAGWWDRDNDTFVENSSGKELEIELLTNQGNQIRKEVATMVQKWWSDIGIKTRIRIVEWSTFVYNYINKKNFDAVLLGWSLSIDPDQYDIWHSSKTHKGEFNFISYRNKEVDRLLELGRRTFDIKKRAKIYHRIHELIARDQPYTFLYMQDSLVALSKRIKGVKPTQIGISYNMQDWYIPEELWKTPIKKPRMTP